jgi:site-specific recombinase XerD
MSDYHEQLRKKYTLRLRECIGKLPEFCEEFFWATADNTLIRTRVGYAYDLKLFFGYLTGFRRSFAGLEAAALTMEDLKKVTAEDIEAFMDYLTFYVSRREESTVELQNAERGKSRKLSAIKSLINYYYKKRRLDSNPAALVDFPKLRDKAITRLEVDEVAKLLDEVESGEKLTDGQKKYHKYTKTRDLAIVTLLLGTGIRLSECVGINIPHINFEVGGIKITRKGGNETVVYFGDEVMDALELYLEERENMEVAEGHEDALFLSMQKKRITDRAVQNLVKKYSVLVTNLKNISPHKLRSTFGTNLYRETGDIYLVADVLGHSDVNTTRKHYAEVAEDNRRRAARVVKLRRD